MTDFLNLDDIGKRLIEIQEKSGLNAKTFCQETDLPSSSYSQLKNGATKINVETINKVISRWGGQFSPMWFLFGESPNLSNISQTESKDTVSNDFFMKKLEELGQLKQRIESLKPKEIERITVFYTDNSVAHFHLEQ